MLSANREGCTSHVPKQPCVVTADGHTGSFQAGVVLIAKGSENLLVEQLGNGKFRVTRGLGAGVGATAGVGANFSAAWDSKKFGAAAAADVSAGATFSGGDVYYADNQTEVDSLVAAHREAVAQTLLLSGPLAPLSPALDWLKGKTGVGSTFPPPDEVYVEGSVDGSAIAQVTLTVASAQADASEKEMLGVRRGSDGTTTTYYQASFAGNVSGGTWAGDEQTNQTVYAKAVAAGKKDNIVEVERDSNGNITAVRVKSVTSTTVGASEKGGAVNDGHEKQTYTENVTELPIHSSTDRAVAKTFLGAIGMAPMNGFTDLPTDVRSYRPTGNPLDAFNPTKEFAQAASDHGYVTRQNFDNGGSGTYDVEFGVEAVAKVSGAITVEKMDRRSTGGEVFDGTAYVPWKGCAAR